MASISAVNRVRLLYQNLLNILNLIKRILNIVQLKKSLPNLFRFYIERSMIPDNLVLKGTFYINRFINSILNLNFA